MIVDSNVNMQFFQAYQSTPEDCFIMISYSGTTLKTQQFVQAIHHNRAKLILVTSLGQSDIRQYADVILTMTTRERLYTNIAPCTSTISTMIWMDLLYSAYFHSQYDKHLAYKRQLALEYEPNRKASHKAMEENENTVFSSDG